MVFNNAIEGHPGSVRGQSEVSLAVSLAISGFQGLGTIYGDTTGGKNTGGGADRDTPLKRVSTVPPLCAIGLFLVFESFKKNNFTQ